MYRTLRNAAKWLAIYLLLVSAPLGLMLLGDLPEGRGFWVEFGVALGFVALTLMCVQFILTGRFWQVGRPFGLDTILQFHRQIGIVGLVMLLAHVAVLMIAEPAYLAFFDPRVNLPRSAALSFVLLALTALVVLSVRRRTFGLSYEWWRLTHGLLAMLVVLIGLAHVLQVGHYVQTPFRQFVWIFGVTAAVGLLGYIRILKPLMLRRRPWRVAEVTPERGEAWTLTLEAEGHAGAAFEPGQYAWLTFADSPFDLQQHPFSFSSSAAEPGRLRFTIKELGDYTATIGQTPLGARAYLEGPYGHFLAHDDRPTVMLAGGIGVTPFVSILETAADADSQQTFYLFYGAPTWERTILRERIERLQNRLPRLTVVYVIDRPDKHWQGERGHITRDVLDRHLPSEGRRCMDYMICGPDPMITKVHEELLAIGVPRHCQRGERFNMV